MTDTEKSYKVIATETVTHEVTIQAENFDDACANWHSIAKNKDYKELDREWVTNAVCMLVEGDRV